MRVEPVKKARGRTVVILAIAAACLSFGVCAVDLYNMQNVHASAVRETHLATTSAVFLLQREVEADIAALIEIAARDDDAGRNARAALSNIAKAATR